MALLPHLLALLLVPGLAHAYIDPGTGSVILQVLLAGFLAAAFTVKSWYRSARDLISRVFRRRPPTDSHE